MEHIFLFAILPLGLASLCQRMRGTYAGFGFLAALAPVLASAAGSIFKKKSADSQAKKQAQYEQQMAAQEEAQRKAQFDAQANSPGAAMQRMGFNMRLGRLLGAMGGRAKVPPSLLKAYDSARAMPTYTPGPGYVAKPSATNGWDFAGELGGALSYFDPSRMKKRPMGMTPPIAGNSPQPFQTAGIDTTLKPKIFG